MSTRATIHFQQNNKDRAIVYRHSDGYPSELGKDLERFLDDLKEIRDNGYDDAEYLAAKYVVWQTQQHLDRQQHYHLHVIGIGIVMQDPGDIEFRYIIDCRKPRPSVQIQRMVWQPSKRSSLP